MIVELLMGGIFCSFEKPMLNNFLIVINFQRGFEPMINAVYRQHIYTMFVPFAIVNILW
jgi:hypothetical protein